MWVLFALPTTASDEDGGGPSSWQCVEENDYFVLQVRQKGAPSSSHSSLSHRSSRRLGDGLVRVATLFSSSRSKGSTLVDPSQGGPIEYRIVLKASLADCGSGDQPDGQPAPADEEREEAEKKKNSSSSSSSSSSKKKLLEVADDADVMEAG